MPNTALVIGSAGQDGTLLAAHLRARGYRLLGVERGRMSGELAGAAPSSVDITRPGDVIELVSALAPDEIYHLAAVHHSSEESARPDAAFFRRSYEVNFFSLLHVLEAVRLHAPRARVFYAASCHVFGHGAASATRQNEETPFDPRSVYAMTKVDGILACRLYRATHGVFAASGILYNHESPLRKETYLTRRVVRAAVEIAQGRRTELRVGDLAAEVDWGYAPDYVEAMAGILGAATADDFIVATGVSRTVRELVATAFAEVGLDWSRYVVETPQVIERRAHRLIGDPAKLTRTTGWSARTDFFQMVRALVRTELETSPAR